MDAKTYRAIWAESDAEFKLAMDYLAAGDLYGGADHLAAAAARLDRLPTNDVDFELVAHEAIKHAAKGDANRMHWWAQIARHNAYRGR